MVNQIFRVRNIDGDTLISNEKWSNFSVKNSSAVPVSINGIILQPGETLSTSNEATVVMTDDLKVQFQGNPERLQFIFIFNENQN